MNEELEEQIKKAQAEVPQTVPVQGKPPYPVYRPSKGEIIWVSDINDVIFVSLSERFIEKAETYIKAEERYVKLGLMERLFYRRDRR